jgi:hypothetical protein
MRLEEPLTFPKAAQEIGWAPDPKGGFKLGGRRLLRLALRREKELGRPFIIRDSGGRPVRITLGALTRFLPELRPSRVDSLAASIRPVLAELERRAQAIVRTTIVEEVDPELQRLHDRDEEIAGEVTRMAEALSKLTGQSFSLPKRRAHGTAGHSGTLTRRGR